MKHAKITKSKETTAPKVQRYKPPLSADILDIARKTLTKLAERTPKQETMSRERLLQELAPILDVLRKAGHKPQAIVDALAEISFDVSVATLRSVLRTHEEAEANEGGKAVQIPENEKTKVERRSTNKPPATAKKPSKSKSTATGRSNQQTQGGDKPTGTFNPPSDVD